MSFIVCVPTLFATNPGTSLATTTPLPNISSANVCVLSITSFEVSLFGMTSTNFIIRGGLKKCIPKNRSLSFGSNTFDIASIGIPEVFVANIASSLATDVTCFHT